ncbi:MAG TPA: glycosyltransferase [Phycisphaerae bacterium]|nr:glycosyltransferase [Phycisphaerae bacterium]
MLKSVSLIPVALYFICLVILTIYGVHRYWQVYLFYRNVRKKGQTPASFEHLPHITVQLPLYNERFVAQRVIEAACRMEYPPDLLQVQVLDDSTDGSAEIVQAVCQRLKALGHDVEYVHRVNREGYKAGALENGLKSAKGDYIAIFDADFVPQPDTLLKVVHYFTDKRVACVQTRWEHINREQSLLTQCQAVFLDGHFMIEHTARNRSGRFINFNGTGGVWRKIAITDAGGWQHDTLTEDMDLSYRAQLRGWKMVFLPEVVSPAELPPEIAAFKQQQHRWTKGSVQTAVKLLPSVMRAALPWRVKLEAFFHLSSGVVYPMAVLLSILIFPTFCFSDDLRTPQASPILWGTVMSLFTILTFSAGTFYVVSQRELGKNWLRCMVMIPFLMAVGMGISLANAVAVLEGLFGGPSEFIRTPKYGVMAGESRDAWKLRASNFRRKTEWLPFVEIIMGLYLFICIIATFAVHRAELCIPFMTIFMIGYFYVGSLSLYSLWLSNSGAAPVALNNATARAA